MKSYTLKPIFEVSDILVFPYVKPFRSHFIQWIYSHILQIDDGEENAHRFHECVQAQRGVKKAWNHSLSLMMPTQRQWGAVLISVTCPCASHQLHYGSISHASSANWIACEVVTSMGVRAPSVPLLL